jgi:hypothetical protein
VVYVPRGVRHKAKGDLTVFLVCTPPGVMGDIHELEEGPGTRPPDCPLQPR